MKFLCIPCDQQMEFEERQVPGDGTFGAAFRCPKCNRSIALLANPMETQFVSALGVKIGGRVLEEQPLELVRSNLMGRGDAFADDSKTDEGEGGRELQPAPARQAPPRWSPEAIERLSHVPSFVRGMVKKIYREYAAERGIDEITPALMDRARSELGLEGM
jgi:hypothetical protein